MNFYDVVKFDGLGIDWLIYKHEGTEYNNKSQLIVSPGQVAIIVHDGKIEKILENGQYKLDSELFPFICYITFVKRKANEKDLLERFV